MPEPELRARLGRALGDGFEVRRLLCRGERADVFEVWERSVGRRLAVKVLRPDVEWTPAMIAAFKSGTGVVARLNHPNILPVHFVGEGEGLAYYARPFVEGESLDWRLRTRGPLPLDEALALADQLLAALHHAHGQGVVHGVAQPVDGAPQILAGQRLVGRFLQRHDAPVGIGQQLAQVAREGVHVFGCFGVAVAHSDLLISLARISRCSAKSNCT